ncbi:MAG: glycosyltransferase family 9 protein, partial [Candidatus Babeliales bacterium]|nr:glycosyltransferase family 9 protein [Candidatus Babeliales bacterium]
TTLETVPAEIPYVQINQQLVDRWHDRLSSDQNFKIGICWHGNTIHGQEKFMPLSYFAQLAQLPHVSLYSLQQHHGLDQLDAIEDKNLIKTFDSNFDAVPFTDTAAVMKNLDLIITIDTSIAHLAGALGVPVWVILPQNADWRWMIDRSDSPWYPTMKLFRQKQPGWQEVINKIKRNLSTP